MDYLSNIYLELLRKNIADSDDENRSNGSNDDDSDDNDDDDDSETDTSEDSSSSSEESTETPISLGKRRRQAISKRNDLDPMDPASYSNIPRGKWSDGLGKNDD